MPAHSITQALRSTAPAKRSWLALLLRPWIVDQERAVERTRARLPDAVLGPDQTLGHSTSGCAATYGVLERCDFACTACYLDSAANAVPPLPFHEVTRQLDAIREELGPWGNTQITAGEVTLLPAEELVRILRYCVGVQLSPMLMSHGQILLDDPNYLERLVVEGGLDNMAIHVDSTQRGRPGWRAGMDERELDPLRERFAKLIRDTRTKTGRPLRVAQNVTVTRDSIEDVPDVVRWAIRNADAMRMISFQPVAGVGRTAVDGGVERDDLWSKIQEGLGIEANERAWHMGHPDCSSVALFWVLSLGDEREVIEVTRRGRSIDRRFFRQLIADVGGWRMNGEGRKRSLLRLAGRLLRKPRLLVTGPLFTLYRLWTERRLVARALGSVARRKRVRLHPFGLVVHRFMDAAELETDLGRERLASCAFRVPVKRADGQLEMVSMCELNASGLRARLNRAGRSRAPREQKRATVQMK